MGLKLKVPKPDWKGKTLKLRMFVLAGAPLVEVDRDVLAMFDFMRKAMRGELSESDAPAMPSTPMPEDLVWEPYSDAKGDVESIYGWEVAATLYCADSKPWWLVRANHKLDEPPTRSIAELERVIDYLGADVKRDCIMDCSFGEGRGYSKWWTWINAFQLLELQARKNPFAMRHVPEGSPLPPGYERMPRIRRPAP